MAPTAIAPSQMAAYTRLPQVVIDAGGRAPSLFTGTGLTRGNGVQWMAVHAVVRENSATAASTPRH